jgi:CHASE2 domain-containing sensor protein
MPSKRLPPRQLDSTAFEQALRKEFLIHFVLIVVLTVFVVPLIVPHIDRFTNEPGRAIWILAPSIALVLVVILVILNRKQFRFSLLVSCFVGGYVMVFWFLAETSFLDWKGSLVGYEKDVPHNFLALNRFGDWHYIFAREEPADQDLAIVTMKRPTSLLEGRYDIARLVRLALASDARGIAFDFYFDENSEPVVDELLCSEVSTATSRNIPVFIAYDYQPLQNSITRIRVAPDLENCLPFPSSQGHMIGYAEPDGRVRMIPLYFKGDRTLESLSLKIAKKLTPEIQVPDVWLLQFTKPRDDFPITSYDSLIEDTSARDNLRDHFVLVGEESREDTFSTPYGMQPGAVIHAAAIHSLRHALFIKRMSWRSSFLMIAVSCFLITHLASRSIGTAKLIAINLLISLLLFLLSALAMWLSLTWIDLIYPLLAVWLLLLILTALRMAATESIWKRLKQILGRAGRHGCAIIGVRQEKP